jgi:protein-arginine deiminase
LGAALLAAWLVPSAMAGQPGAADVRVDANRDGRIDLSGDSDTQHDDQADADRGAVFLPNLDTGAR